MRRTYSQNSVYFLVSYGNLDALENEYLSFWIFLKYDLSKISSISGCPRINLIIKGYFTKIRPIRTQIPITSSLYHPQSLKTSIDAPCRFSIFPIFPHFLFLARYSLGHHRLLLFRGSAQVSAPWKLVGERSLGSNYISKQGTLCWQRNYVG